MQIAVTSQDRKTVTEHAGRCRKFWLYSIENNIVKGKTLVELAKESSFHESSPHEHHVLDPMDILITRSVGAGLRQRLAARSIDVVLTSETDPDLAVSGFLRGVSSVAAPDVCEEHGHHQHRHEGHGDASCGCGH